ncbi:MAG: hypothetical protein JWM37_124 [Candidatus Saccharibacteria bacterium]|nr:hypothetical protein [Candidatus Saccharibacteria bacterium]
MVRMKSLTQNQIGFTIVELMVATMVFSSIILVITFGVLQFSNSYYKGVTSANTQNAARNILESVSGAIQFSGATLGTDVTNPPFKTFCFGGTQYNYVMSKMRDASTPHVLYSTPSSGGACNTSTFGATSRDLVDNNMRVVKFTIKPVAGSTSLYVVSVRIAYGADDLLCSPSVSGDCDSSSTSTKLGNTDLVCKISTGKQFCATSELTATVQKRIQP